MVQASSRLGLDGLLTHIGFENLGRDDAALEKFAPHAGTDAIPQNRVLAQGEIYIQDAVGGMGRCGHGSILTKVGAQYIAPLRRRSSFLTEMHRHDDVQEVIISHRADDTRSVRRGGLQGHIG